MMGGKVPERLFECRMFRFGRNNFRAGMGHAVGADCGGERFGSAVAPQYAGTGGEDRGKTCGRLFYRFCRTESESSGCFLIAE